MTVERARRVRSITSSIVRALLQEADRLRLRRVSFATCAARPRRARGDGHRVAIELARGADRVDDLQQLRDRTRGAAPRRCRRSRASRSTRRRTHRRDLAQRAVAEDDERRDVARRGGVATPRRAAPRTARDPRPSIRHPPSRTIAPPSAAAAPRTRRAGSRAPRDRGGAPAADGLLRRARRRPRAARSSRAPRRLPCSASSPNVESASCCRSRIARDALAAQHAGDVHRPRTTRARARRTRGSSARSSSQSATVSSSPRQRSQASQRSSVHAPPKYSTSARCRQTPDMQ